MGLEERVIEHLEDVLSAGIALATLQFSGLPEERRIAWGRRMVLMLAQAAAGVKLGVEVQEAAMCRKKMKEGA